MRRCIFSLLQKLLETLSVALFGFEAAWLSHAGFKDLLATSWDQSINTRDALERLQSVLKKWNKEVFGDIKVRKEKLTCEITEVQAQLDLSQSDDLLRKEEAQLQELDTVLEQEETLWFQKSREKWVAHGDKSTKFFHTSTIIRRRRNRIGMLKDNEERWVSSKEKLEELAVNYFTKLYSLDDVEQETVALPDSGFVRLSHTDQVAMNRPFTESEVLLAIRSMGSYKAPGPDGYQPIFYQRCWEEVRQSVLRFVLQFFNSGVLPQGTNDVLLALIPKVTTPEKITKFQPISLCNVLFKIITKTMVSRMKGIMSTLIGPAQSSFIPGRLGTDNIIIVQETVHSMRRKQGQKGWMLLKLDLEKANDRIRWDFLEDSLRVAGFSDTWTSWIMQCVTGPSMSLLWNGEKMTSFKPSRGLRQGDPLSPYLFVLCMERLCHLIEAAVLEKQWKPIRLSRGGPRLSHICFADDLILLAEASVAQIRVIRHVLERFCSASGQKVSLDKSKIFFSDNVSLELGNRISAESGIQSTKNLGKYLGLPILQKRINKETFGEVVERVSSRLAGWKSHTLSLAGRITLTRVVLSSIPVHTMSTISLPVTMLQKLDKISRDFVWGSTTEKRRQHLVSWEKICRPKREGGLGIRKASEMNKALISKVGWRVLNDTSSLWAKVLRSKYHAGDIRDRSWLVNKNSCSSTWRSVCVGVREVIPLGLSWVIRDGRGVGFWTDRWLRSQPLMDAVIGEPPQGYDLIKVRDMWTEGIGWDLANIVPLVPEDIQLELLSLVIDSVTGVKDRLSWGSVTDGKFTVKSAYHLLTQDATPRPNMELLYGCIWKVQAPERVRVFLWLVDNHALMTNEERYRRHLSETAVCQVCRGGIESTLHILRDCEAMSGIWSRIVPLRQRDEFFSQPLLQWLYSNLCIGTESSIGSCSTMFAVGVWWAWKWRCGNIFGDNKLCRDRVQFIKDRSREVGAAQKNCNDRVVTVARVERMIRSKMPSVGWFKMNTDGASKGRVGAASAGGVLRDEEGNWRGGFALNIGRCSAPLAELWGVYYGLAVAWEKGARRLELEVDSELIVGFLKDGIAESHPLSFLARPCYGFLLKDWIVRVTHVYREANYLADGLANLAFSLPLGFHLFESIPVAVETIWKDDVDGLTRPRRICL